VRWDSKFQLGRLLSIAASQREKVQAHTHCCNHEQTFLVHKVKLTFYMSLSISILYRFAINLHTHSPTTVLTNTEYSLSYNNQVAHPRPPISSHANPSSTRWRRSCPSLCQRSGATFSTAAPRALKARSRKCIVDVLDIECGILKLL
jgi:hypothetical protein